MAWKLSVLGYEVDLSRGYYDATTLNGAEAVGQTTIKLAHANAPSIYMVGDILKLGPSTHADNPGAFEWVRIDVLSPGAVDEDVTVTPALVNAYSSGDPVSGTGSRRPTGFEEIQNGTAVYTFEGINPKFGDSGQTLGGFDDSVKGATIAKAVGTGDDLALGIEPRIDWLLPSNLTSNGNRYRLLGSIFNQGSAGTIPTMGVFILDKNGTMTVGAATINDTRQNVESTPTKIEDGLENNLSLGLWASESSIMTAGLLSHVLLVHALKTSTESSAFVTLPDPTRLGKGYKDRKGTTKDLDNYPLSSNDLDNKTAREYSFMLDDVTETELRDLEILQYWQSLGNRLVLESDFAEDPPTVGYIVFNLKISHWDIANKMRVELKFIGE